MKLVLVLLLVAVQAAPTPRLGAVDWGQFWRGLVYGVQRNPSVPSPCVTGAPSLGSDWTALLTALESLHLWQATYALHKYVDDWNQIANLCNLQGLASNVQEYATLTVLAAKITINLSFYTEVFADLSSSWQAGAFYQAGVNVGKILSRTYDYYI